MMKSRFCPSPTGHMHLGNVRTALFNALLARGAQGTFLLRIEDTDKARSSDEFAAILQQDMRWLGLVWQEGPEIGGQGGPYWQSQRQAVYDEYYHRLETNGLAYPCFCTEQQLALARKVQLSTGQPPRYAGTCRHLSTEDIAKKRAKGLQPTLRFKVQLNQTVEFQDLVHGLQKFNTDDIGDFIIRRADGSASFIYCNALDDALMGVTHALRGEDHLTNTPRQLLVLQALGLPAPSYGHISLILGPDHAPLSKRNGSRSIKELREAGFLAEAIVNYLARLGHHYEAHHYMSFDELSAAFSTQALGASPAHYDAAQLQYWQKEAVAHLSSDKFWNWVGTEVQGFVPADRRTDFIETIRPNVLFPSEAEQWARIFFEHLLPLRPEALEILVSAGENFFLEAINVLEKHGLDYQAIIETLKNTLNVKGKALFQPLRVALTGELHGPEMDRIISLLGIDKVRERFNQAATRIFTEKSFVER